MSTSNNIPAPEQQDAQPYIDAAKLIAAKRSSSRRFRELVHYYRNLGASDTDIIAAMISSPLMVDTLGRRR